jgi:superfamily II DNA/RNA helicase
MKIFKNFKFFCNYLKPAVNVKHSIDRNNSINKRVLKTEENILSFREFKFIPELYDVLDRLNINAPKSIQSVAIPKIMEKKNLFFASQTGTGKTFAYLLPILNELKEQEQASGRRLTMEKRPRALIVVPTRELAQQVEEVCKIFIYDLPLKIEAFYVGRKFSSEKDAAYKGIDILISTPERFKNHWGKNNIYSTKLTHVIIDELDTLLDAGNEEFIKKYSHV